MNKELSSSSKEIAYSNIRTRILNAQNTICRAVNSAIVRIGKLASRFIRNVAKMSAPNMAKRY